MTGTREDHHAIFFNLAHSCLVIDEADFYDDFTQQNIVMLLRALRPFTSGHWSEGPTLHLENAGAVRADPKVARTIDEQSPDHLTLQA